jgi:hypothetical protein
MATNLTVMHMLRRGTCRRQQRYTRRLMYTTAATIQLRQVILATKVRSTAPTAACRYAQLDRYAVPHLQRKNDKVQLHMGNE